ncbi:MAG: cyclic nucleotide-binding domain-containing protein [Pseudomonadales bacterium]
MKAIPIANYPQEIANAFLNGIAFVNEVRTVDKNQLDILMKNACFMEFNSGEILLTAGKAGRRYSFLLKGQLSVYPDDETDVPAINQITPGQNFGGLSIICKTRRTATIAVSPDCKTALILSLDLTGLGELHDFSIYTLQTKLALYRAIVNNTRWQLELYKMDYPTHPLTLRGKTIEVYIGPRNTEQELVSLDRQAHQLVEMIMEWNQALLTQETINEAGGTWL